MGRDKNASFQAPPIANYRKNLGKFEQKAKQHKQERSNLKASKALKLTKREDIKRTGYWLFALLVIFLTIGVILYVVFDPHKWTSKPEVQNVVSPINPMLPPIQSEPIRRISQNVDPKVQRTVEKDERI